MQEFSSDFGEREIGDEDLLKSILSGSVESGGWRGKAQQISLLQSKLKIAEKQLSEPRNEKMLTVDLRHPEGQRRR